MRGVAVVIAVVMSTAAAAQQYPSKVVRLVTGSSPGGGADVTARAIQQRLIPALGVQVIVDNRPGVAGMLANEYTSTRPKRRPMATRSCSSRGLS